jgi:hypothetical protein
MNPTNDVPRHLRIAIANATRAFAQGDLAALATINEDIQPLVDAAISWSHRTWARRAPAEQAREEGRDERDRLRALILRLRNALLPHAEDAHYGHPFVDNPNDFHPDPECCSEQEIAAHAAACIAYNRGEPWERPASTAPISPGETTLPEGADTGMIALDSEGRSLGGRAHVYPWGIGTSTIRDADLCALIEEADALLSNSATPSPAPIAGEQGSARRNCPGFEPANGADGREEMTK